jgi:TRAP-type C4-dicarboxylate transport system permease small subunit
VLVTLTWNLKQYSAVLAVPIAYIYSVMPITGFLICFYAARAVNVDDSETSEGPAGSGI